MSEKIFGQTRNGEQVSCVEISGGGLSARVLSWGAVLQDLRLDGYEKPLVLGFEAFDDYEVHSPYFGATVGRVANRLKNAELNIQDKKYKLEANLGGKHMLHGGSQGIGVRNWQIEAVTDNSIRLGIVDPDGWMGFPGECKISCTYALLENGVLSICLESESDTGTICNLCNHSYFNLDDEDTILDHEVMIHANQYLPLDEGLFPTGEIADVDGTPLDFTKERPVRWSENGKQFVYDLNYCLAKEQTALREIATVKSPKSGVQMSVATTEPGVQFYIGNNLDVPVTGLTGKVESAFRGLCLETQFWPDAPNNPHFPSIELAPGQKRKQITEYRFQRQ